MSDTPRTDAAVVPNSALTDWGHGDSPYVLADFARKLEREHADLLGALKLAALAMEINDPHYFDESETAGKIRAAIAKAERR